MQLFLLEIAKWAIEKLGYIFYGWFKEWNEKRKAAAALKANKENLLKADASGDLDAIKKADQDALNNTGR